MRKLLLLVVFAFPLFGQDAAKVGPDVYKCIFENDRVRLCEVSFKPGARVGVHSHPQHLVYVMAPGKLSITPAGKSAVDVEFKAGEAHWSEPDVHSAVNNGKTEVRGLVLELKDKSDAVANAILQMERDWMNAILSRDHARMEDFVADDWTLTDPMGQRVTRVQALEDLRSGTLTFESSTPMEQKVTVYGDTAIVNGISRDKGTYKGMDISGDYAFIDVFVKRDGAWRAVSSQITRVMPMP